MSRNASVPSRCLPILCLLAALPAAALEGDRNQPMQVRSDRFEAAMDSNTTVLSGNVRITQGSLVVNAARADITQDKGEVSRAVLTGAPATLTQGIDGGGEMNARARTIDYRIADETVELTGDVVLERPQGTLRSERVTYSVKTGQLSAGEGVGGGVQFVIPPKAPKPAEPATVPADAPKLGARLRAAAPASSVTGP